MADGATIAIGKELLEMAIEIEGLSTQLNDLSTKVASQCVKMESKNFYNGRNRENLDTGNHALQEHIAELAGFYGMTYAYIANTYVAMIELDEGLAKAIQEAYIEEHYGK